MNIMQPKFWYKKSNLLSKLLYPFSQIYFAIFLLNRRLVKEKKIKIPVICVGNFVIGGSGKTPIVIYLRKVLSKKYKKIFVILRAYKTGNKNCLIVNKTHSFRDVGDEAMVHLSRGDVCITSNRVDGAQLCLDNKADLIILDDGFQSKHLYKNLNLIVVDANQMLGNQKIIPSGPLRESLNSGFSRAHAIIIIDSKSKELTIPNSQKLPHFYAYKNVTINNLMTKNVYAFCGLGYPQNFFDHLISLKLNIKKKLTFSDHHVYKNIELENILYEAENNKLDVITTEKDIVKIPKKFHPKIKVAKVVIKMHSENRFKSFIYRHLH